MRYLMLLGACLLTCFANAQKLPFTFNAKGLLVLSDADMVASAYIDGKLQTEPGIHDQLTLIAWGDEVSALQLNSIEVSNSVTNWVNALDIANDGNFAFVVDTRGALPRDIQQVSNVAEDLPMGKTLYAIDIRDLRRPKIIDSILVNEYPLSVDVNPVTGQLLIVGKEKGKEIVLVDWTNQGFGEIISPKVNVDQNGITHGSWHPSGTYFGITLEPSMQIAFFKLESQKITPLGKALKVGSYPGAATFSKNGKFYLVPNLRWDQGYNVKGSFIAVQFDEGGKHQITSEIEVGISPEGFALSPQGDLIAVSNMGTNFMPYDFPLFGESASLTLLGFDDQTGQFEFHDEKQWEGVLPEGISFDQDGDMLVTTSFDYLDLSERKGGISFWQINKQAGKPQLNNTGFKISLTRGSHYVRIIE